MKCIICALLLFFNCTGPMAQLNVIISGGFNGPYSKVLPEFEKSRGLAVKTYSGASQGNGPQTIKSQLQSGVAADVVILSKEGLDELAAAGRILEGSEVGLALSPLGAAVSSGSTKPDIATTSRFKEALLNTQLIVVPASTSGIYLTQGLFPRLGLANLIKVKVTERGSQATALLAAKGADMAIQPTGELFNVPGIEFVGRLPSEVQLVQVFSAAIVKGSPRVKEAKDLIEFLSSPQTAPFIVHYGMDVVKKQ